LSPGVANSRMRMSAWAMSPGHSGRFVVDPPSTRCSPSIFRNADLRRRGSCRSLSSFTLAGCGEPTVPPGITPTRGSPLRDLLVPGRVASTPTPSRHRSTNSTSAWTVSAHLHVAANDARQARACHPPACPHRRSRSALPRHHAGRAPEGGPRSLCQHPARAPSRWMLALNRRKASLV
jgi:hypothetical protein